MQAENQLLALLQEAALAPAHEAVNEPLETVCRQISTASVTGFIADTPAGNPGLFKHDAPNLMPAVLAEDNRNPIRLTSGRSLWLRIAGHPWTTAMYKREALCDHAMHARERSQQAGPGFLVWLRTPAENVGVAAFCDAESVHKALDKIRSG